MESVEPGVLPRNEKVVGSIPIGGSVCAYGFGFMLYVAPADSCHSLMAMELGVQEQKHQALLAVLSDGRSVSEVAERREFSAAVGSSTSPTSFTACPCVAAAL